nr:nucleosome assembly protein 1;3-like [Ipomoea batatas]
MWIREDKCKEIAVNSWSRTLGLDVLDRIERDDGAVVSSVEEIGKVMLDYFSNLFTTTNCEMDEVLECITSLLNPEANNRLLRPNKHDEFEVEYNKEKAALDAKYHKIYYPLYQQVKVMTEYKTWELEETRTEESHPSGCGAVHGSLQL